MASVRGSRGVEELRDAAAAVGLDVEPAPADSAADLVLINPAGGRTLVEIKRVSLVSADNVGRRFAQRNAGSRDPHVLVLVADRVTEQARQLLREAGWSWLDLRGHLHLAGMQLFVDAQVPSLSTAPSPQSPLTGRVGQEVAAILLLDPTRPASVREIARALNRAPSSVSEALKNMLSTALIDNERKPVIPNLFWELAARWNPVSTDVQSIPSPAITGDTRAVSDALRIGLDNVASTPGWALTDTLAAASYGAAVATRSDYPPDFYVPDQSVMRRALHLLGPVSNHENRAATIRVAPLSLVSARRVALPDEPWPLAKPLFVALDLARDPGRGREVLEGWTPPQGVGPRVW